MSQGYIGCWLEMKFGKNKPTTEQRWWLEKLTEQGYFCVVPYSMEEAAWWILNYLQISIDEILLLLPVGWRDKVDAEKLLKNTPPRFASEQ